MQMAEHGDINTGYLRPYGDESRHSYTMTFSEVPNFPTTFFPSINNGDSRQLPRSRYLRQCSFAYCDWGPKKGNLHRCKKAATVL